MSACRFSDESEQNHPALRPETREGCVNEALGKHISKVTTYCVLLAESLRQRNAYPGAIDDAFLADIRRAAPLHDLGKIGIPDSILFKPGRLSPHEVEIMHRHCQIGADCIRS